MRISFGFQGGKPPLYAAVEVKNPYIVENLLDAHADPNMMSTVVVLYLCVLSRLIGHVAFGSVDSL